MNAFPKKQYLDKKADSNRVRMLETQFPESKQKILQQHSMFDHQSVALVTKFYLRTFLASTTSAVRRSSFTLTSSLQAEPFTVCTVQPQQCWKNNSSILLPVTVTLKCEEDHRLNYSSINNGRDDAPTLINHGWMHSHKSQAWAAANDQAATLASRHHPPSASASLCSLLTSHSLSV